MATQRNASENDTTEKLAVNRGDGGEVVVVVRRRKSGNCVPGVVVVGSGKIHRCQQSIRPGPLSVCVSVCVGGVEEHLSCQVLYSIRPL